MDWIKTYRNIEDHWISKDAEFFRAWIFLIMKVNWKEGKFVSGDDVLIVERGEIITSESKLCEKLKLSRKRLRRFIKLLESDSMIEVKTNKKGTRLKVLNYASYQDLRNHTGPTEESHRAKLGPTEESQRNHRGSTIEERKEGKKGRKEERKKDIYIQQAEEVYNFYHSCLCIPKNGKDQSLKNIKKILQIEDKDNLFLYIENYKNSRKFKNDFPEYVYKCSNFFGQKAYWKDYIEQEPISLTRNELKQKEQDQEFIDFINGAPN